jgi:predicted RecA/RadA family phage recombinase
MKNYVHAGIMVPITAPSGGLSSGDPVLLGSLFGVAAEDAAEGATVEIALTGVYDLPKHSGDVVTAGASLYWDDGAGEITITPASDSVLIGAATEAAGGSAATVRARLNGISVQ